MAVNFQGRWRGRVVGKNAGFAQRVLVSGAASGNGAYPGNVGQTFAASGPNWNLGLQWNDNAGSGWQDSAVVESLGLASPLVVRRTLRADDNVPASRDGDFDDLVVELENLDPLLEITQRPFALDRGSLTMLPDGIFDAGQGVQYMGVRIRNSWRFDWTSLGGGTGMKVGFAPSSRAALASQGILIMDSWTAQEEAALGQVMDNGSVRVEHLPVGAERMIYFKLDFANAAPGKPEIGLVAQRQAFDPAYAAASRTALHRIFVTRLDYDPATREIVAHLPEASLHMRLLSAVVDRRAANRAAAAARACLLANPRPRGRRGGDPKGLARELRSLLAALLAGKDVDPCKLRALLERCCDPKYCDDGSGGGDGGGGGGFGDGSGSDDWCRIKPVAWLPIEFEYSIRYRNPFAGQHGPLAFEDPWWKVVLIILAILLALGSLIADYVGAASDANFIIGKVVKRGDPANNVDCALSDLNGSRGVDLGALDAQSDDVNNGFPIQALDGIVQMDRSDNGDDGIQDAAVGDIVWKSGGTTATTRGVVIDIDADFPLTYDESEFISGTVNYTHQVVVGEIATMPQPLSNGGDSGSVWVNLATARPVALNFASPRDESINTASANRIREVVNELDIRFNV